MSFSDHLDQLEQRIGDRFTRAVQEFRDEVRRRIEAGQRDLLHQIEETTPSLPETLLSRDELAPLAESAERAGEEARNGAFTDLAASLAALDRGRSQAEVLNSLLAESGRHASRTALFLTRGAGAEAWGAHGWGESAGELAGLTVAYETDAWRRFAAGAGTVALRSGDCAALCSRIESPLPADGLLVPLVLRDRMAAALYADRLEGERPLPVAALQTLTYVAALLIESLPFRERPSTPTLATAATAGEAAATAAVLPLWDGAAPAAVAAPAAEPEAEAAVEEVPEPEAAAEPPPAAAPAEAIPAAELEAFEPPPAEAEIEVESEAEPLSLEPAEVEPAAYEPVEVEPADFETPPGGGEEVGLAEEAEPEAAAPTPWSLESLPAEPEVAEPAPPLEPAAEEIAEAEAAAPIPAAGEEGPDAEAGRETVLVDTSRFAAGPTAAPAPPMAPTPYPPPAEPEEETQPGAPHPAPAAERTTGTQVAPPSDFEGPGLAFATTHLPAAGSEDAARHEEARRLARLLVSEIRLYNEDQVEEGRRNRDLYARLREDIERSRQMYEERVDGGILGSTDYFGQELVRILGAGDADALGPQ